MEKIELNLLERLQTLEFTKIVDNCMITDDGISLKYHIKLQGEQLESVYLQIILRLIYKEQVIWTWGCISDEEQRGFVTWYMKEIARVKDLKYDKQDADKLEGLKLLNNKIK
jgi:hypothetical protein